jgi:hypothetical protein
MIPMISRFLVTATYMVSCTIKGIVDPSPVPFPIDALVTFWTANNQNITEGSLFVVYSFTPPEPTTVWRYHICCSLKHLHTAFSHYPKKDSCLTRGLKYEAV